MIFYIHVTFDLWWLYINENRSGRVYSFYVMLDIKLSCILQTLMSVVLRPTTVIVCLGPAQTLKVVLSVLVNLVLKETASLVQVSCPFLWTLKSFPSKQHHSLSLVISIKCARQPNICCFNFAYIELEFYNE